jgi:hypothetical protein
VGSLKKKEAVLAELASGNYLIEEIAEKVKANKKRVLGIIGNQILRGKLGGMVNIEETEYLPEVESKEYRRKVRMGIAA